MADALRVLLIENSEDDAELIRRFLKNAGYSVTARRVEDGPAMRSALLQSGWDVIVSDHRLPRFDARSALEILKSSGQDIPFIVISGSLGEEMLVEIMKAGAHDYLRKDNLLRLASAIEREIGEARMRVERRQAEADLAESRERLDLTIAASELGAFDYLPQTGKVLYSGSIRDHLGISEDAPATYEDFLEAVHPADRERVHRAVQKAMQPGEGGWYAAEYRTTGGGRQRWVSASGRVYFDSEGRPVRFVGATRDITPRKQAQKDARFQLYLTHSIARQSADAILVADSNGRAQFVNDAAEKMFGFTLDDWKRSTIHELVHRQRPDGRPFPASECPLLRCVAQRRAVRDIEDVFYHRDGAAIPVLLSLMPLKMAGVAMRVVITIRDITERKRTESVIRESEQWLRRLIESDVVGIAVGDAETVLDANGYLLKLIGGKREDLSAGTLKWDGIGAAGDEQACFQALRELKAKGACPASEKELVRRDGSRIPALVGGVVASSDPFRILMFVVDLTERRSLENQIRESQKMESIGLLAGSIAHDFNNLLSVIRGYAAEAAAAASPAHAARAAIDEISLAAERASELTGKLLTFGRRAPRTPKVVNLNDIVRETERMLARLVGPRISMAVSLAADPSSTHADPSHIEQVIINLVVNARDAMPEGGTLYVETSRTSIDDDFGAVCLSVPRGDYVMLSVTDTGIGMPPDIQSRIFEPFFTTKENGSGLGLSTVYGIMKQAGGAITVHSAPNVGSTFRALFPAIGVAAAARSEDSPESLRGVETILLTEDDSGLRRYIAHLLESHGYTVLDAMSGEDAIELAKRYRSPIHLLLTDTALPGRSGSETAAEIEAVRPGIAVLRMSGYVEPGNPPRYIQKPFTPDALLRAIRAALPADGGASVS